MTATIVHDNCLAVYLTDRHSKQLTTLGAAATFFYFFRIRGLIAGRYSSRFPWMSPTNIYHLFCWQYHSSTSSIHTSLRMDRATHPFSVWWPSRLFSPSRYIIPKLQSLPIFCQSFCRYVQRGLAFSFDAMSHVKFVWSISFQMPKVHLCHILTVKITLNYFYTIILSCPPFSCLLISASSPWRFSPRNCRMSDYFQFSNTRTLTWSAVQCNLPNPTASHQQLLCCCSSFNVISHCCVRAPCRLIHS